MPQNIKSLGAFYTPPALARLLARLSFGAYEGTGPVRILDPACGDGNLLSAAAVEAERLGIPIHELVGFDVDQEALAAASERLAHLDGVRLVEEDFIDPQPNLSNAHTASLFDIVIANPPYVRTQTMGTQKSRSLAQRYGLTGKVDLYHVFALAMTRSLTPGGAFGLLCSNKFLSNATGQDMRQMLTEQLDLRELIDLGDTKLFGAAVLPAIVTGRIRSSDPDRYPTRFRSVYETKQVTDHVSRERISVLQALEAGRSGMVQDSGRCFTIREGIWEPNDNPADPWVPVTAETKSQLHTVQKRQHSRLGDIAEIRVGVKTTADSVFIRNDWDDLPDELCPEAPMLRPLITHREVQPWTITQPQQHILYPYYDTDSRTPIDLAEFPRTANYLEQHREQLSSRQYIHKSGRQWFEIWVPQQPALWHRQKIVFPDIAAQPRFAIDKSGAIVNGDCYWMNIEGSDAAEIIAAIANSTFFEWFYDSTCGNYLYAGRRRFMKQYVSRLPLPEISSDLAVKIRCLRENGNLTELETLISGLFGLQSLSLR